MGKKPSILISFVGSNDPFSKKENVSADGNFYGPIISAIKEGDFDNIFLLATPSLSKNAEDTFKEIKQLYPNKEVKTIDTEIQDPTSHTEIIKALKKFIQKEQDILLKKDYEIFISVTSGTPSMHACLLLLAASNMLPAKVIHCKEARFAGSEKQTITQIDFTRPEFPVVSPKISREWKEEETTPTSFYDYGLIGESENFIKACQTAWKYAKRDVDILILGETGTGKELFAEMIHKASGRKGECVPFNCHETSENLFESALFGHKKGSFTGASDKRDGLCKTAENGTLFLDEIGDVPNSIQVKLLRFLETKKFRPIGVDKEIESNVRFVFATNRDLKKLIEKKQIREDFYHRIAGFPVTIPPLRERVTDIPLLVKYFISKFDNKTPTVQVTPEAMSKLMKYNWPGNVRELRDVIKKAIIESGDKRIITPDLLDFSFSLSNSEEYLQYLPHPYEGFKLETIEKEIHDYYIQKALEIAKGNQSEAARLLGITPQSLSQYLKKKENLNES
ncbi:MAG TPA: sigma-54 dependent transcriptional regulator [Candidatus Hydrogenedens sp.]|nr:sigma-54 dependent transcriptional regulator [Candidatus Hydrogenedens sp.]